MSGTLTTPRAANDTLFQSLVDGWLLSYIVTYTSALPFNIQLPNDRNGDTNFNDRPLGVGRNTGEGFDYQSLDLRLSRTFALGGGFSVETIVDGFNVLNRANYQVPNNIFTSPTFGQPTAVNEPRQFQLGLRLLFDGRNIHAVTLGSAHPSRPPRAGWMRSRPPDHGQDAGGAPGVVPGGDYRDCSGTQGAAARHLRREPRGRG